MQYICEDSWYGSQLKPIGEFNSDLEKIETTGIINSDSIKESFEHAQITGNPHNTISSEINYTSNGTVSGETVQDAIDELGIKIQTVTDINLIKYGQQWYGVEWDITVASSSCTRIGNMGLHVSLPVQSLMRRCILKDNGVVNYYLHPTDSTKKEDGSNAILDGTDGQVMVEIPEFYYETETDGNKRRFLISKYPIFPKKFNKMYISAYEASLNRISLRLSSVVNSSVDYRGGNNTSTWDADSRSLLGKPVTNISLTNFRTYARNRGGNWNCNTYIAQKAMYWLYVTEYANFNCQLPFNSQPNVNGYKQGGLGDGVTTLNSTLWTIFNSTNPVVNCGYTNDLGNISGVKLYTMPNLYATGVTVSVNSYRGVENTFGHIWKWTDGCKCNIKAVDSGGTSEFYVCNNPANYQDTDYSTYVMSGLLPRVEGYVKTIILGEFGEIMPLSVGGSSTTYMSDYFYTSIPSSGVSQRGVLFGGAANGGANAGFGAANTAYSPSYTTAYIGSRLCFLI